MHQRATVAPPVGARQSGATARPVDIIEADPEERVVAPLDAPSGPIFMQGELVDGVYEVRGLLGEGGMAQVYEAYDHLLERTVALKAAWPEPGLPPLRDEAKALAKFQHPSLVTVHTVGEHRGIDFIVMERIYGVPLSAHISSREEQGVPFKVEETLEILAPIAEGLSVVHRTGLAHRDVKPSNVMLTPDGRIVLMDFGLVLPEFFIDTQTAVAGSPPYMPPEALTNTTEQGRGQLIDVYALGVIAFEMLTGRRPFPAKDLHELFAMLARDPVPDIAEERNDLPPGLDILINEMLSKNPDERPPSAEGVAWQLRSALKNLGRRQLRRTMKRPKVAESAAASDAEPATVPKSDPPDDGRIDVLIVEDDDDIAKILTFYVKQIAGKETSVRRAHDGEEAVTRLRERAPDMMLLDLHMPKLNGIEVCMQLRGERLAPACKIVSVSAGAQPHDLQLLHQLGMHHFVQKGGDLKTSLQRVMHELFPLLKPEEA